MENIKVALRTRPLNDKELLQGEEIIWSLNSSLISLNSNYQKEKTKKNSKTSFKFDYCFSEKNNNLFVYEKSVKEIAMSSLKGINGTIFMYGQTGSGKTFTTIGNRTISEEFSTFNALNNIKRKGKSVEIPKSQKNFFQEGILTLALQDIFEYIEKVDNFYL